VSEVRALIAKLILGELPKDSNVGRIELHPHQASALQRLNDALDRFNGALLCDEVGMGKTYVAIAVARPFTDWMVVTPAALVPMWRSALERTESKAQLLTFETLSRADFDAFRGGHRTTRRSDLVIVDEAHHVRNPRTNRYFALEHLVRGAKVLLLSATPIHNRRDDLVALLALFLGSRATTMTAAELSQCVIRREQRQLENSTPIPRVRPVTSHSVGDEPAIVDALMNLPPPVPVRDGGVASALVGRSLLHQWASSEAALREALRRRIGRAIALCNSLEAGTYPTLKELEQWVYDDGAIQLGFAQLLSSPTPGHVELLGGLRAHLAALQATKKRFNSSMIDSNRADVVMQIRASRDKAKIVAFSQYTETIAMLYRRLVKYGYVAMLTSHGARVAGGPLTRTEAIARFAPLATGSRRPPRAEAIQLLLTTDLLSEGVNLQDADTVVHVDVPWTAARMEQRVGRVARIGSIHGEVYVHLIRPPSSAGTILNTEPTVERKWNIALAEEDTPRKVERLRDHLDDWRQGSQLPTVGDDSVPSVAAATSDEDGFIAAVTLDGIKHLVVGDAGGVTDELNPQLRACGLPIHMEAEVYQHAVRDAVDSIHRWCGTQRAASAAGIIASQALGRRELIARIDLSIESAPPHQRSARLALAERARNVVTRPQCADVERELETILHASLPEEEWLAAVANLDTQQAIRSHSDVERICIHAILLLTVTQPRSQPLPDPGCP
jgi:superfamily II DNA or RNA helicase